MAKPSVTVPLPSIDGGLVVNLFALASLAAICVAVAYLTDWRYAVLSAGVLGFLSATYVSHQLAKAQDEAASNVTPIKKAS